MSIHAIPVQSLCARTQVLTLHVMAQVPSHNCGVNKVKFSKRSLRHQCQLLISTKSSINDKICHGSRAGQYPGTQQSPDQRNPTECLGLPSTKVQGRQRSVQALGK
eukprot:5746784-Amphidinium_carterae.1